MTATVAPNTASISVAQPRRSSARFRTSVAWLLAGMHPERDDTRSELLHPRAGKRRTLVVAIFMSLMMAMISAALTGAAWAYAWMAAEIVIGGILVYLMLMD